MIRSEVRKAVGTRGRFRETPAPQKEIPHFLFVNERTQADATAYAAETSCPRSRSEDARTSLTAMSEAAETNAANMLQAGSPALHFSGEGEVLLRQGRPAVL